MLDLDKLCKDIGIGVKNALDEAFDPMDPTGYFAKRDAHRELELKVNRCMQFIRSGRCRQLMGNLAEAGIGVKINIAGRNKIHFRIELDQELYPAAERTVYSFILNHYNGQRDPFNPSLDSSLASINRIVRGDNPQAVKMLDEIASGLRQN